MSTYLEQSLELEPMTREETASLVEKYKRHDDYTILHDILRHRRGHQSYGEAAIIEKYIEPLNPHSDEYGNKIITRGDSDVLFSCHLDTVCSAPARDKYQSVGMFRNHKGRAVMALAGKSKKARSCLGADDGAGVFIMLSMLDAGVPGTYIFHRAEEIGCLGSGFIAKSNPDFLKQFKYAIAFDRQDFNEVITHQSFGRTASDAFAQSLASVINAYGFGLAYEPSAHGVYTDTNEYAGLIPECTNIGVGYQRQHGPTETLDVSHCMIVKDAFCAFDESKLVAEREPGDDGYKTDHPAYGRPYYGSYYDDALEDEESRLYRGKYDDYILTPRQLAAMVRDYPEAAADLLDSYGLNYEAMAEAVMDLYGAVPSAEHYRS